jgi:asparagine synthase (glutamine-hydrolysing)
MCGIFALLNVNNISPDEEKIIKTQFIKGKKRGPEYSKLEYKYYKTILGFHRLAINGLNIQSNQPIVYNNVVLICNGEIYNYKQLYKSMNVTPITDSDCEVIIHLYIKYGIEQTLNMLDGVYSFLLFDNRPNVDTVHTVIIARDPLGIRPLYQMYNNNNNNNYNTLKNNLCCFASELKCLQYFYNIDVYNYHIKQFEPGTYSIFQRNVVETDWKPIIENKKHFILPHHSPCLNEDITEINNHFFKNIYHYLWQAVVKRCDTTERPVACLLSGGLDSSLIAALTSKFFKNKGKQIETYSIGLQNSDDIKYAKIVADYIGSKHTEIIVTEDEMFHIIPEVINAIESYDTTTVRASIGNYLLGKYITKNSDAKVIFNGDGADELFGGYLYMNKCPDNIEFDKETKRLLKDIHLFDVLRSDKTISSNGLEPRTPFLDKNFVNYVLSIPSHFRNHNNFKQIEKYLLRQSFHSSTKECQQILPDEILFRKKEAFSDGVSSHGRSLYKILQEKIAAKINTQNHIVEANIDTEKMYYKQIFASLFPNCQHILPYFWMPKYTDSNDPSARTLSFYSD